MNQPNILILHLDELRQDCLGCYGNPDIQTPNIDALAADGVTYQNHYTVYPVCTPSRYSLFSSLYVHQSGHDEPVVFYKLDSDDVSRDIAVMWKKKRYVSKAMEEFTKLAAEMFSG